MSKTILITGASSGIGKATAKLFHDKGWNVIASMRSPDKETELIDLENVAVVRLDVTDESSIQDAIDKSIAKFKKIDVLLNNAGYGAYGPLEAFSMDSIRRQFDTNVVGLLATTKAVLPYMRANLSGTIVNISSIGGKMTFPLGTLYHGTKFAVEGLSEALHYELEPIGIKIKIIEPGMINTDFGGRSFEFANDESLSEYQSTVNKLFSVWGDPKMADTRSEPELVSEVIWNAVTDGSKTLRYTAGEDAIQILSNRREHEDDTFISEIKTQFDLT